MYTLAYTLVSWVYDLKQLGNFHVIVTRRRWQSFTVSAIWMVSFVCTKNVCMYSNELFNSRFLQLLSVFFRCYWCCRLVFCSISLLNKFLLMSKARFNFCIYCFFFCSHKYNTLISVRLHRPKAWNWTKHTRMANTWKLLFHIVKCWTGAFFLSQLCTWHT